MASCTFCGKETGDYGSSCWNTRDMEQFAIEGDDRCYEALRAAGGGEKGMRYVDMTRAAIAKAKRILTLRHRAAAVTRPGGP